ncbi:unnamed protein product [Adineta steineri]|uniref:Ionotropic glutamate receptor C-terminal domain-containing protein n=1 Tax=Adineta steineri TaxID=433720 RepID=A0A815LK61_9BILA|nr:unnamed protein product [Adineta steineri]CAF3545387.1 unnamed protein product [Adineta steineri]
MGMWFSIGVIVEYGVDFHVRTAAGRLLTMSLYILSIVFVATYTANFTSYLREISSGVKNYYPLNSRDEQYQSLSNGLIDADFDRSTSGTPTIIDIDSLLDLFLTFGIINILAILLFLYKS